MAKSHCNNFIIEGLCTIFHVAYLFSLLQKLEVFYQMKILISRHNINICTWSLVSGYMASIYLQSEFAMDWTNFCYFATKSWPKAAFINYIFANIACGQNCGKCASQHAFRWQNVTITRHIFYSLYLFYLKRCILQRWHRNDEGWIVLVKDSDSSLSSKSDNIMHF